MAVMIEPRKEEETDPVAAELARLDKRVSVVEVKLDGLNTKVNEGFEQADKRFVKIDDRFERMHGLMLHAAIALFGTFITGFGILAGLIIAQS
jgi:hypothetical protein